MIILAVDASTKSSGFSVFDNNKLIHYECTTASSTDVIKRIYKMVDTLSNLIQQYKVETVIIEEVRPDAGGSNPKTMKALMWLQAAIAFKIHDDFPKVKIEYTYPSEWRSACGIHTGRGIVRSTLKEADIQFVKDIYNIEVNDDIADSICIGYAYINKLNNEINYE